MKGRKRRWPALLAAASLVGVAFSACATGVRNLPAQADAAPPATCSREILGTELLAAPIVVLGETHGTEEIPAAFADLVCGAAAGRHRVLVGLEVWSTAQPAIDAYLESDGGAGARAALVAAEFWRREYQDGRSSEAMAGLIEALRGLRAAGRDVVVRALDDPAARGQQERDDRMAQTLGKAIDELRPTRTLVLVGDVHARVLPGFPWAPEDPYRSLAARLREASRDLVGLHVQAAGGSAWICSSAVASECGVREWALRDLPSPAARLELPPDAERQTGWSGTLYLPRLTASPPAVPR